MDHFRYDDINLKSSDYRLLRLLQGQETAVQCQLLPISRDNGAPIEYEALSYTWGFNDRTDEILLNGKKFPVTANLFLALQHLRYPDRDRVLWVDAICIDQANPHERGHQVQQMGSIFKQAKRVIFWLNIWCYETNVLMDSLKALEDSTDKDALSWDWEITSEHWRDSWSEIQSSLRKSRPNLLAHQRQGLELLLKRSWFDRVWILQEVANAQAAIVCAGTKSVSGSIFAIAPLLLRVKPKPHCQAVMDIMPSPLRSQSWWNQKRDLYTLLSKFNKSEATDERDKIYALLGIASNTQDSTAIAIDYTKTVVEVFQDVMKFLSHDPAITISDILDLLSELTYLKAVYMLKMSHLPRHSSAVIDMVKDPSYLNMLAKALNPKDTSLFFLEESRKYDHNHPGALFNNFSISRVRELGVPSDPKLQLIPWGYGFENVMVLLVDGLNEALEDASSGGHLRIVELLLQQGADPNTKGRHYCNALQAAVFAGHGNVVETLLKHGAKVNANDRVHSFSLFRGDETITKLVITHGSNNALQEASSRGYEDTVKQLLEKGYDVNEKGGLYGTALQSAVVGGHLEIVRLLILAGADVNAQSGHYGSALKAAKYFSRRESITSLLHDNGAVMTVLEDQSTLPYRTRLGNDGFSAPPRKEYGTDPLKPLENYASTAPIAVPKSFNSFFGGMFGKKKGT